MNDGLKGKHRDAIIRLLAANPRVERAVLFGSRAMGTHTATSDVDIALFGGELTLDDQAKLASEIERLPVPQRVDLLRHHVIKSKELRKHIKTHGIEWYRREEASPSADAETDVGLNKYKWKEVVLGEVAEVCLGKMLDQHKNKGHYLPYLANTNVQWGRFQLNELRQMKFQSHEIDRYGLKSGDIVMCEGGEPGRCALWRDETAGMMFQKALHRIRPYDGMDSRYLYYCLFESGRMGAYEPLLTGTTIKHLPRQNLLQFRLSAAPLPVQRSIAHILGTLDDKIELNRRMNGTLEKMAAAIFKSWFIDFDPIRAKAEGRDPGLPADIADLFPDTFEDSELGMIPKGWTVKPIGEVVRCVGGTTPSTRNPEYWEGGKHPFVTPKDMSSLQGPVILDSERHITDAGVRKISSKQLPVGTVILSSRAPIGYLGVAVVPVSVNQGVIAMICEGDLPNLYVVHWTAANMDVIKSRAGGTTFAEISKRNFRSIPVLVPADPVLDVFSVQVAQMYERLTINIRQNCQLAGLRDTLLPKLLSGEVEIPKLEVPNVR